MLTRGRAPQGGKTPLHLAAYTGQDAVARVLLEARADVNARVQVRGLFVCGVAGGGVLTWCLFACGGSDNLLSVRSADLVVDV